MTDEFISPCAIICLWSIDWHESPTALQQNPLDFETFGRLGPKQPVIGYGLEPLKSLLRSSPDLHPSGDESLVRVSAQMHFCIVSSCGEEL